MGMLLKPVKKNKNKRQSQTLNRFSFLKKLSIIQKLVVFFISLVILIIGFIFIWISTLDLPDFNDFENRVIQKSTKLYDREGKILLYDIHKDFKRTVIPLEEMGDNIKKATIALEDDKFYSHIGIRPKSIIRAVYYNFKTGQNNQGGSTITQQIVKNTLLSSEKTITRKIKEWVLALKIEQKLSKNEILSIYLNESPYGGNIYGVEQASQSYFGKQSKDLTISEAAYIASIPQRPTYFNPFGKNNDKLLQRKDFALERMKELKLITENEYTQSKLEEIKLNPSTTKNIKAPHFVFYIQDYLIDTFGEDVVNQGGLKVTTTLDYNLQKKAEEIVLKEALNNEKIYGGNNMGMVGIDPKTSQILFMVGSRDYFDEKIDGAYNIATAQRQPGSSFKPFVYALAFEKGYLPETIMFDVPTEFNPSCSSNHIPLISGVECYAPQNYTGQFYGAVPMKKALGSSLNIPAVQTLYLVGINNAINFARDFGLSTLKKGESHYGLSLVLGGAEVKLLEMVNAYGVFANNGLYRKENGILLIKDSSGKILEEYKEKDGKKIISENTAKKISQVLSDNKNRFLVFGANSMLNIPGRNVAVKTGTTNSNKDAWIIGYTKSISIGAWAGNNDGKPMTSTGATIAGPAWNQMFNYIFENYADKYPDSYFDEPEKEDNYDSINPIIKGEIPFIKRSILYFVDKNNPRGPSPTSPQSDPQYSNWESGIYSYFGIQKEEEKGLIEENISNQNNTEQTQNVDNVVSENITSN
jgi:penicillin-binding protein 1C